jgi:hypothetical protein
MTTMRKEDMVRLFIQPPPRNFFFFLLKLSYFFFLLTFCDGFLMTFHADIEVGYPGKSLSFKEAVASVTVQSLFQMLFVTERDGLLSLGAKAEADEKEEQNNPNGQPNEERFHLLNNSSIREEFRIHTNMIQNNLLRRVSKYRELLIFQ